MFARRTLGKLLASTAVAALLIAGCSSQKPAAPATPGTTEAPKAEEKRLTLYTSFGSDLFDPIAQAFEKETGIKVDVVSGGTGDMMKRIDAEKAAPQGDVMLGGGADSFEAYRAAFEPYQIKDDAVIPANLKAADHLWYANNSLPMVIAYNKNMVKESDKPTGWKDLADPKWKGKIVMANASKSGTSYTQVTTILTIFGRDDNKGWDMMKAILNNAKIVDSSSLTTKGVNDGEFALSLTAENAAWKYIKAGGPVGVIYPAEGTATMFDSAAVLKGAHHPQNARLFMDWLYGKAGQGLLAQLGLRPARPDVTPEGLPSVDKIKLIQVDQTWAASKRNDILSKFQDLITK